MTELNCLSAAVKTRPRESQGVIKKSLVVKPASASNVYWLSPALRYLLHSPLRFILLAHPEKYILARKD